MNEPPPGDSSAPFGRRAVSVIANERVGSYQLLRVSDQDGPRARPGQFAMLAAVQRWGAGADERPYLPRAFSYARSLPGEAQFLLQDVGPGTARLCELAAGDQMWLLGPLGQGFAATPQASRSILVGGGIGVAPLILLAEELAAHHDPVVTLAGFRDAQHAAAAALMKDARLATDDGSLGHHGLITDLLSAELRKNGSHTVFACGPPAMLEAVRALCERERVEAQLALEAGMACGFGACFGCVVADREGGFLRVCVDGPVIDARRLGSVTEHVGGIV